MSDKKITKVSSTGATEKKGDSWKPTEDNKSKAITFRAIAVIAWVIAIGFEIWGIMKLRGGDVQENGMKMLIVLIVVALIFAVAGNLLWKKANKLDPASEKDKFRFFVQNQLGAIISVIAFLPLVILILSDKNLDGKQKGILGAIAGAAMLIAFGTGVETDSNSVEKETDRMEETRRQESKLNGLTGSNAVYWTEFGKSYHIYSSCSYINGKKTKEIFEGTVSDARELKNISDLCDRCEKQAEKEQNATMLDLGGEEDYDDEEEGEDDEIETE